MEDFLVRNFSQRLFAARSPVRKIWHLKSPPMKLRCQQKRAISVFEAE
jgi:hypothetical protein